MITDYIITGREFQAKKDRHNLLTKPLRDWITRFHQVYMPTYIMCTKTGSITVKPIEDLNYKDVFEQLQIIERDFVKEMNSYIITD